MPVPTQTVGGSVNPYSTMTQAASPLNKFSVLNHRLTGLVASTTYPVGVPTSQTLPALYLLTVDGTVEYGLFVDTGGDNNLVKVAGTTNVETVDNGGAATGTRISLSKLDTTGGTSDDKQLTVVTGAATLIGTAISIFKIV